MNVSRDFIEFLQRLYGGVRQTILVPQADPRQTLIIGSILILTIAILVLIGLSLYSFITGKKRVVVRKKVRPLTLREILLIWGAVIGSVLILVLAGYAYVERPSFCANCHTEKKEFQSWKKSSHRGMGCLACHRAPGLSGYMIQKIDYLRWAWNYEIGSYSLPLRVSISNSTCKKCHSDMASNKIVTSRAVRVRHKDFLDKGSRCTECHNTIGHESTATRYPSMDECITCHNTKVARADCKVCHTKTPRTRQEQRELVRISTAPIKQCRACHKPSTWEKCIRCHGLEMPHPDGWREGHSRLAFVNKSVCFKCHSFPPASAKPGAHAGSQGDGTFCNYCHSFPSPHGTSERWIRLHGPVALRTTAVTEGVCLECHGARSTGATFVAPDVARCALCHSEKICDRCHESGRYTPSRE